METSTRKTIIMSVTKKDIARIFDQWWFGSSLFGLAALFLWLSGVRPLFIGMALGAGLASFVRLFWAAKGNQEGVDPK